VRVSVEFVIGMSRGSARFHSTGGCTLGVKGKRGRAHRQTGGTGKMWPACEISVPTMYRRYKPGGGRGTGEGAGGGQRQRWRCPSATRLHIGELSAGPGPRDRCDAAIPRRRRRVRSPTNFPAWEGWGGVGKAGAGGEGTVQKGADGQEATSKELREVERQRWQGQMVRRSDHCLPSDSDKFTIKLHSLPSKFPSCPLRPLSLSLRRSRSVSPCTPPPASPEAPSSSRGHVGAPSEEPCYTHRR